MRADVVVLGGGFAGISAAVQLVDAGFSVLVLEKKRLLGGRAFSYNDPETGEVVDNGQHLLMGCYHQTLDLLSKLKTEQKLFKQPGLQVDFLDEKGNFYRFDCPANGRSFNLVKALFGLSYLSFWEKCFTTLSLLFSFNKMNQKGKTVSQWLEEAHQPKKMRDYFWAPFCLAALNDSPDRASAALLKKILDVAFLSSPASHGLIFPQTGLSDLTGKAAQDYLESRHSRFQMNTSVKQIHFSKDQIERIELTNGETISPKFVISTLPPTALLKILPHSHNDEFDFVSSLKKLKSSPILSIHVWLNRALTEKPFFALLDSPIHWLFNRQAIWDCPPSPPYLYSLVISGAHEWIDRPNEEIQGCVERELTRFFPNFHPKQIERIKIIKEPHATLAPAVDCLPYRLNQKTKFKNFFLAGDWTDTGLPATIESAVLSGKLAVQELLKTDSKQKVSV